MKILFLDIDGVVNNDHTTQKFKCFIGINPELAELVKKIVAETGCDVVLSSTWRTNEDSAQAVKDQVCDFVSITPILRVSRGREIASWLNSHDGVERYAILDDDSDMLLDQLPNFFQTSWADGLTPEIADAVIAHLIGE